MAVTLSEIRSKYPEYNDLSDQQLADSLHAKFYADMPKPEFYAKIGLGGPDMAGMVTEAAGRGLQNLAGMPRAIGDFAAATDLKARQRGAAPLIPNPMSFLTAVPSGKEIVQVPNNNPPVTTGQKILAGAVEGGVGGLMFGPGGAVVGAGGGAAQSGAEAAGADELTQVAAGLAGGLGAGVAANTGQRLFNLATGKGNQTLNAMRAEGVTPNLAGTVSGGNVSQMTEKALAQSFSGGGTIREAATRVNQQIGEAVERAASTQGRARSATDAGQVIQEGIKGKGGFVDRFKQEANRLYQQLEAKIPRAAPVDASNTKQAVAELQSSLQGMPETAKSLTPSLFGSIERDLAAGNAVPFATLSRLRSEVGSKLADPPLVGDVGRADLKKLYAALTKDMEIAAQAAGAGGTFARATTYWQAGMKRMEDTLQRLADAGTPERAFQLAMSGSKQGATDLYKLRRSLAPDEWGQVSSAVLRQMGRKASGADEIFDVGTFLGNWNRMSAEAKTALFRGPGMRDYARSVDNLATMAKAFGESAAVANRSNTSGNSYLLSALTSGFGAGAGFVVGSGLDGQQTGAALGAIIAPAVAAKLMTSPSFVKWLSTPVGKNKLPAHLSGLTQVVRSEPELADAAKEFLNAISASEP